MTTSESRSSVSRLAGALRVAASSGAPRLQVRSTSRATTARLRNGVIAALVAAGLAMLVAGHSWPGPGG